MKMAKFLLILFVLITLFDYTVHCQISPDKIKFIRQGVQRMIFNEDQSIPLASLQPDKIIGLASMHPTMHYAEANSNVSLREDKLVIQSELETQTGIWFGGFNPFASYTIDLASCSGEGEIGFEFSDADKLEQVFITVGFNSSVLTGVKLKVIKNTLVIADESIAVNSSDQKTIEGKIILQMLGSGLVLYFLDQGLPMKMEILYLIGDVCGILCQFADEPCLIIYKVY